MSTENSDVDPTIDRIVNELKKGTFVKEVILIGSFSRGEECVAKTGRDKKTLSDYDFWIITSVPRLFPTKTQKEWKALLGDDYSFVEENYLMAGKILDNTTTEYIDAKNYGKVLYGSGKEFRKIVSRVKEVPPVSDGMGILIDKIPHLFLAESLEKRGRKTEAMNELTKVITACGDYIIIKDGQYDSLLSRRAALLEETPGSMKISKLYRFAMRFRSNPVRFAKGFKKINKELRAVLKPIVAELPKTHPGSGSLRVRLSFPVKLGVGWKNYIGAFIKYPSLKQKRVDASLNLLSYKIEEARESLKEPISWVGGDIGELVYKLKVAGA